MRARPRRTACRTATATVLPGTLGARAVCLRVFGTQSLGAVLPLLLPCGLVRFSRPNDAPKKKNKIKKKKKRRSKEEEKKTEERRCALQNMQGHSNQQEKEMVPRRRPETISSTGLRGPAALRPGRLGGGRHVKVPIFHPRWKAKCPNHERKPAKQHVDSCCFFFLLLVFRSSLLSFCS